MTDPAGDANAPPADSPEAPAPPPAPAAPTAPAAAGYLMKRSRFLHRWERVFCRLLEGGSLAYAADPPNGGAAEDWAKQKAKCLKLEGCSLKPLAGRERAFEITTGDGQTTVALSAETDEDLDMWMAAFLVVRGGGRSSSGGNSNTGCCLQ